MGFSRQEYWSGLPFPSPGDLPNSGTGPVSPALAGGFFTTQPGNAQMYLLNSLNQTFKSGQFIICKPYLNQADLEKEKFFKGNIICDRRATLEWYINEIKKILMLEEACSS